MRINARTLSALALAVAVAAVPAAASAKPAPAAKVAKWAKKNGLRGSWKAKDTDKDGLKNFEEYKLGTNPRKADSDRDGLKDGDEITVGDDPTDPDTDGDGIKDGAEHAGVVTAFDGETVTVRQFTGGKLTAPLSPDADCAAAGDDGYVGDDSEWSDDFGDDGADAATVDDDPTEVDLGGDDASAGCGDAGLEKGAVVRSLELEDGEIVAVELVD